jgi:hypothetical protein
MPSSATPTLAQRIRVEVEHELDRVRDLRTRLGATPDEGVARTLAVLARTLHALDALEGDAPTAAEEEDTRDLDEFRRELTRRLAAIHARRAG